MSNLSLFVNYQIANFLQFDSRMQYLKNMTDVEFIRFKKLLKENGNFITTPRMRLFGLLQHHPSLTLKQIIKRTTKHDQVTVYRNVDLFEKLGIINRLRLGWHTKIELSDIFQHHHHHLSCVNCGKVWALKENNVIENQISQLAMAKDFKPMDHQLEIRGICKTCQKHRTPGQA